jgi:hypothetical protein
MEIEGSKITECKKVGTRQTNAVQTKEGKVSNKVAHAKQTPNPGNKAKFEIHLAHSLGRLSFVLAV